MKVDNTDLKIARVEIFKRVFNEKGQVIGEEVHYFYPKDENHHTIKGFTPKK